MGAASEGPRARTRHVCSRSSSCRCAGAKPGGRSTVADALARRIAHRRQRLASARTAIDRVGENAGFYERATGGEVCAYFTEAAMRSRRQAGSACSPATSTWAAEATAKR